MKYCKKCNKPIESDQTTSHGLCASCYHDFLLDKIEHLGEKQPEPESSFSRLCKKIKKFVKK